MLQNIFGMMKEVLPPKTSFRLRAIKSDLLDNELHELLRFARRVAGPDAQAVDVGANAGIYSAALAKCFRQVISIEPNPDCVAYMQHVLPPNCKVVSSAVSDAEGRTTLRIPVIRGASETTRATISTTNDFDGLDVSNTREIDVAVQSLDDLARRGTIDRDRLRLIKIDVEGHEFAALNGARDLLGSARPALYIEMERRHGAETSEVHDLLRELGYVSIRSASGRYVANDESAPRNDVDAVNQLFVTKDRLSTFGVSAA